MEIGWLRPNDQSLRCKSSLKELPLNRIRLDRLLGHPT